MIDYCVFYHSESMGEGLWKKGTKTYAPAEALRSYAMYALEYGEANVELVTIRDVQSYVTSAMTDGGGWIENNSRGCQIDES